MNLRKARLEFCMLVDRCGCSRASLRITPEEAKKMNRIFTENGKYPQYTVEPVEPSCTPEKCYPELYKLLFPKGDCPAKSHLLAKKL